MSQRNDATPKPADLPVVNLATAHFDCVYPTCGGICCMNGRPAVEPREQALIAEQLPKFVPHLLPAARALVERSGFLSDQEKEGLPTLKVSKGWCVFFNEGCVLHKVGATEGDRFKYKPWRCVAFPLTRDKKSGEWSVRQRGERGEAWDLFCLNPAESPKRADTTLAAEVAFVEQALADGRIPPLGGRKRGGVPKVAPPTGPDGRPLKKRRG
ncbi:MAG: DUF3109 family protein [Planctomycetes bacterium]|nr:DUF3109 family protein [Planctomycetota bacterium]